MIAALFADTNIKLTIILMVIACLLPFVCAALAKYLGGYNIKDNQTPREFLANTHGAAARLNHAQTNSIINILATGYLIFRICFIMSYATNLSILRSVTWMFSLSCCIMLFILAYQMGI